MKRIFTLILIFIYSILWINAQPNSERGEIIAGGPKLNLDCWQCDHDYMKRSLDFVNFVRNVQSADIYIKVTSQSTGGGRLYKVYFEGQNEYIGIGDTLQLNTENDDTDIERNASLLQTFKKGLLPYLIESPLGDRIDYKIDRNMAIKNSAPLLIEKDPWNYWVFSLRGSSNFRSESNYNSMHFRTGLNAGRKTEKSKVHFSYNNSYRKSNFYFRDEDNIVIDSLSINSINKNQSFWTGYVHSLNDHWSLGLNSGFFENTFSNYELSSNMDFGIEYNVFPYDQSDRQIFVFSYKIGPSYNTYVDTTIYDKKNEWLYSHKIEALLLQNQKWGDLHVSARYSSFLHDFLLSRFSVNPGIDWNVFKGFTLEFGSELAFINDQINLPKIDADISDILLRDKLLATNYEFSAQISLRYSFGSDFANVVNPRFWGR